jgi:N-acyl-D-amino-acid deacylase
LTYDIIAKKGRVVDGTGNPWFYADVGIKDGKITEVGDLSGVRARWTLDCEGLVVCPGFIDMHSHSEFTLLVNSRAESKIKQGVTTKVTGNCGFSPFPVRPEAKKMYKRSWAWDFMEETGLDWDWASMKEFLARLKRQGIALNVAPLVGHDVIRSNVLGFENRRATEKEMDEMKKLVADAMRQGFFGLSSGLIYPPGCYADTGELVELCKVVAKYGGFYATHIRGESDTLFRALREAIEISRAAGIAVEISHLKLEGEKNWGRAEELLGIVDEARAEGVDVTFDVYPYTAGCFDLESMLPPWVREGGTVKLVRRLKDPGVRERLKREMLEGHVDWSSPLKAIGWGETMIVYCSRNENKKYEGRNVGEISKSEGVDPFDFAFDLLVSERDAAVIVVRFSMLEDDVRTVIRHPAAAVGSDGLAVATCGVFGGRKCHPRYYGTFPRVLARYVR